LPKAVVVKSATPQRVGQQSWSYPRRSPPPDFIILASDDRARSGFAVMLLSSGKLNSLYLTYFSKPAQDRAVYRAIDQIRPTRIMELGVGSAQRTLRMIGLAAKLRPDQQIEYVGIDEFEMRTHGGGLPLREAFKLLRPSGARLVLLPGTPCEALSPRANELKGVELVVVSADQDQASLARAWYYLPRTLGPSALVLTESSKAGEEMRTMAPGELDRLARQRQQQRRAAA